MACSYRAAGAPYLSISRLLFLHAASVHEIDRLSRPPSGLLGSGMRDRMDRSGVSPRGRGYHSPRGRNSESRHAFHRKKIWLLVAIVVIGLLWSPARSQQLPGPAGGGWYVLMAANTSGGTWVGPYYVGHCSAVVVPSSRRDKWPGRNEFSKRYGPYPTREAGYMALIAAGWLCHTDSEYCTADVGC